MAITLRNTPADNTPVHNPITWTATSDNDTQPDFAFIVEIYIAAALVFTYRIQPEPDTGNDLMIVDVSKVLRNYVTRDLYSPASDKGILDGNNSFTAYQIRIGEEYIKIGVLTQFLNLANATAYTFNAALSYTDFIDYNPNFSNDWAFLTDAPLIRTTDYMGLGSLHLLLTPTTTLTSWVIKTYLVGVLQNTYTITTALAATNYYTFAAGFDSINLIDSANITGAPAQPILTTAIDKYTVEAIVDPNFGDQSTEVRTYNLVSGCLANDPVRIHWFNRLGGYDFFDFALTDRSSYNVTRKKMKQQINPVTSVGVVSYSKQDRNDVDFCVTESRTRALTSDWITEAQSEWLKDIISTQDVYIEEGGELIAVNITDSTYDVKQTKLDQLFQLELKFKYAVDSDRQQF